MATKKKKSSPAEPPPIEKLKKRFPARLGDNIERYLLYSGESKIELGEYLGLTRSSPYKWIAGGEIKEDHVLMLAYHWDTTPAALRYGAPEVDFRVLRQVFQALRLHQQEHPKQKLSVDQEARLCSLLYENAMTDGVLDMSHLSEVLASESGFRDTGPLSKSKPFSAARARARLGGKKR